MLKITEQRDPELDTTLLVLEGRLAGPWVEELKTYCRTMALDQQRRTVIDLTEVTSIDGDGKTLLKQLWETGMSLHAMGCLNRYIVAEITGGDVSDL